MANVTIGLNSHEGVLPAVCRCLSCDFLIWRIQSLILYMLEGAFLTLPTSYATLLQGARKIC